MLNEARPVRNWTESSTNQTHAGTPLHLRSDEGRGFGMETGFGRMEKGRCDAAVSLLRDANAFRFIAL